MDESQNSKQETFPVETFWDATRSKSLAFNCFLKNLRDEPKLPTTSSAGGPPLHLMWMDPGEDQCARTASPQRTFGAVFFARARRRLRSTPPQIFPRIFLENPTFSLGCQPRWGCRRGGGGAAARQSPAWGAAARQSRARRQSPARRQRPCPPGCRRPPEPARALSAWGAPARQSPGGRRQSTANT